MPLLPSTVCRMSMEKSSLFPFVAYLLVQSTIDNYNCPDEVLAACPLGGNLCKI